MDTCSTNNMRNTLTASRKEKNNGRDGTTKRKLTTQTTYKNRALVNNGNPIEPAIL